MYALMELTLKSYYIRPCSLATLFLFTENTLPMCAVTTGYLFANPILFYVQISIPD